MDGMTERHVVVIVDDDPQVLAALRRALGRSVCEILTTDRPETAIRWVETRDVSLVISDQRMPELTGTALLEEVRRRSPSTVRLLLTAYPGPTAGEPGLRQHVDGLFSKPWDVPMLRRAVREFLRDREGGQLEEGALDQ